MLLPQNIDFDGPFPKLSRRLRLGIVGGGRISGMQATAARLTDRWEVVAGAFSSDPVRSKAAAKITRVELRNTVPDQPNHHKLISRMTRNMNTRLGTMSAAKKPG